MFREVLANLLTRVEGARWAVIAGLDGVLLEAAPSGALEDADRVAAEYAALIRASQRAAVYLEDSALQSWVLATNRSKLVFQLLTPEYFLLMGLTAAGHSGQAKFEIERSRDQLERELVF